MSHRGKPRLNSVQMSGGRFERRWQVPVYATEREARVSGSGWLHWLDCESPESPAQDGGPDGA